MLLKLPKVKITEGTMINKTHMYIKSWDPPQMAARALKISLSKLGDTNDNDNKEAAYDI